MSVFEITLLINYSICLLFVVHMIFFSQKKPERIIAWTLFLVIPYIGLLSYLVVGAGLNFFAKRMIKKKAVILDDYNEYLEKQIVEVEKAKNVGLYPKNLRELILLNLKNCKSLYTTNNAIQYYSHGQETLDALIKDIEEAKSSIHIEFYIFANDKTGKILRNLLLKKAKEGVEIRLMYDAIGSLNTPKLFFRKIAKAGGQISVFFPPFMNIKLLNLKANHRNHRKIVVIDGKIGYTGGFNIRDDHMGKVKRLSPWRDTSVRITGNAVYSLQNIFLSDWRYSTGDKRSAEYYNTEKYFPTSVNQKGCAMQVISSGPDSANENIKQCMVKMLMLAKKRIRIQSPYFIPDETFLDMIKLAILSGIKVEIMLPEKIDHIAVHYASLSYLNEMIKLGVKVYLYKGFIHSKTVLVDNKVLTLGSCNIDIRSFSLNFEDNIVIYSKEKIIEYSNIFDSDIKNCTVYDEKTKKQQNIFKKMLTSFFRLFSAIL